MPRVVRSRAELVAAIRERVAEVGITQQTLDHVAGWADGFAGKVLGPRQVRRLGPASLRLVLDALALGIAAVVLVEDPDQAARMRPRWQPRKYAPRRRKVRPAEPELPLVCVAGPTMQGNGHAHETRRSGHSPDCGHAASSPRGRGAGARPQLVEPDPANPD